MKPIKFTNETKLREFQFLNRIVPNNSFLIKCKIAFSSLCGFFFNANPDSLEHYVLGMSARTKDLDTIYQPYPNTT